MRRAACLILSALVLLASGCALFAPSPRPAARPPHVIVVEVGGLTAEQISPVETPHLYRMKRDGAYAWTLASDAPDDRTAVYSELFTGLHPSLHADPSDMTDRSLFTRCRRRGLGVISLWRTPDLAELDREGEVLSGPPHRIDHPAEMGARAGGRFLAERPELLFVELSPGGEDAADCDAGLGKIVGAVHRAGVADRTTVIVVGTRPDETCWLIRGPGTRHGHQVVEEVSAPDTFATASRLLGVHVPDARGYLVADAFRDWARTPPSSDERVVPRGSVRGTVLKGEDDPMSRATVLLVKDEPVDGIHERWADTGAAGAFAFDDIPAGTYDYVFVFDNLPTPVRRSLLVARNVEVEARTTTRLELDYRRLGADPGTWEPVRRRKRPAAFLTDSQVEHLGSAARKGEAVWPTEDPTEPPLLAADVLAGRRLRTGLVRSWLIESAATLRRMTAEDELEPALVRNVIDLAAAYDLNRGSGLLSRDEKLAVVDALSDAATRLNRAARRGDLPEDTNAYVALELAAVAVPPQEAVDAWSETAEDLFEARFDTLRRNAEQDPRKVDRAELCSILEYALINDAVGCGNYLDDDMRRLVRLVAWSLPPEHRRPDRPAGSRAVDDDTAFLGLVKTAFADEEFGGKLRALWDASGRPYWMPRGDESVLGSLFAAAAMPSPRARSHVRSEQLTPTTAVLTHRWGDSAEWFVHVSGWDIDVHLRATDLARSRTWSVAGRPVGSPEIVAFIESPACDYLLLSGDVALSSDEDERGYRHVLFNKHTGYLVVWDEFPEGARPITRVVASGSTSPGILQAHTGVEAQVLGLEMAIAAQDPEMAMQGVTNSPVWALYLPPPGRAPAELESWSVDPISLAAAEAAGYRGRHLKLTADRGAEFIRLGQQPAWASGDFEDVFIDGKVGVVRRGERSEDFILVRAEMAMSNSRLFRLARGTGFATIYRTGRAEGWSRGRSRRATVRLGAEPPGHLHLEVNSRSRRVRIDELDAVFRLRSGEHTFTIEGSDGR